MTTKADLPERVSDIVERLRGWADKTLNHPKLLSDAADEIEHLRSQPGGEGRALPREAPSDEYRKKPVIVRAMQWDGSIKSADEIEEWSGGKTKCQGRCDGGFDTRTLKVGIYIETLEGEMRADPNDWIIRGVKGEFYPCKPDIFAATYERASTERGEATANPSPSREEVIEECAKLKGALERIASIPFMPFPDPGAHSWQAYANAVHRAWAEMRSVARLTLAGIRSLKREEGSE